MVKSQKISKQEKVDGNVPVTLFGTKSNCRFNSTEYVDFIGISEGGEKMNNLNNITQVNQSSINGLQLVASANSVINDGLVNYIQSIQNNKESVKMSKVNTVNNKVNEVLKGKKEVELPSKLNLSNIVNMTEVANGVKNAVSDKELHKLQQLAKVTKIAKMTSGDKFIADGKTWEITSKMAGTPTKTKASWKVTVVEIVGFDKKDSKAIYGSNAYYVAIVDNSTSGVSSLKLYKEWEGEAEVAFGRKGKKKVDRVQKQKDMLTVIYDKIGQFWEYQDDCGEESILKMCSNDKKEYDLLKKAVRQMLNKSYLLGKDCTVFTNDMHPKMKFNL